MWDLWSQAKKSLETFFSIIERSRCKSLDRWSCFFENQKGGLKDKSSKCFKILKHNNDHYYGLFKKLLTNHEKSSKNKDSECTHLQKQWDTTFKIDFVSILSHFFRSAKIKLSEQVWTQRSLLKPYLAASAVLLVQWRRFSKPFLCHFLKVPPNTGVPTWLHRSYNFVNLSVFSKFISAWRDKKIKPRCLCAIWCIQTSNCSEISALRYPA